MRKKLLLVFAGLIIIMAAAFAGCAEKKEVKTGKYYQEGFDDVYIEIFDDHTIQFVNYDFTVFKEALIKLNIKFDEEELDQILSGVYTYRFIDDRVYVTFYKDTGMSYKYSGDGTLTKGNEIFVLRAE